MSVHDAIGPRENAILAAAQKKSSEGPFVSITELAKKLGVSVRTVRRMQARSVLPPRIKRGRELGYHRTDIDAWLAERRKVSGDRRTGA